MKKRMNLEGKRFTKLVAISEMYINRNNVLWLCKCDCGKEKYIKRDCLTSGDTKSCGCIRRSGNKQTGAAHYGWKGYQEISGSYLNTIKANAKKRKIEFCVTLEYLWDLFIKQDRKCAISGVNIEFKAIRRDYETTASLDRIDSSKGYVEGNLQWVHKDVNFMKQELSDEKFINW